MEVILLLILIILVVALIMILIAQQLDQLWKSIGFPACALAIVLLLTSCVDPTPTATPGTIGVIMPVPGERVISGGDIEFILPEPTPALDDCGYGLQAWERYPVNPNGVQEIGAAVDLCAYPVYGQQVTVCVNGTCQNAWTDESGQVYTAFGRDWGIGAIPYSVCIDDAGTPVCLRSSFMAESESGE